jgi:hypothetical protein
MEPATNLKLRIYDWIAQTTVVPTAQQLATDCGLPLEAVRAAMAQLESVRLLVLDKTTGEIRMAPPFSAVPTQHQAVVRSKSYSANCVWDAFGVVAAMGGSGVVATASGGTGSLLRIRVTDGSPEPVPCVFHYAVPAARWWQDIVFT